MKVMVYENWVRENKCERVQQFGRPNNGWFE